VFARFLAATICSLILAACGGASSEPSSATDESDGASASEAAATAGTGETISVFDLSTGQCFDAPDADIIEEVELIDCASPHTYEIYAAINHSAGPNDAYPGDEEIAAFAEDECRTAFEPFVGLDYDSSELFIFYLHPTADTWRIGDREVLCTVYLEDGLLEGSVEGSQR